MSRETQRPTYFPRSYFLGAGEQLGASPESFLVELALCKGVFPAPGPQSCTSAPKGWGPSLIVPLELWTWPNVFQSSIHSRTHAEPLCFYSCLVFLLWLSWDTYFSPPFIQQPTISPGRGLGEGSVGALHPGLRVTAEDRLSTLRKGEQQRFLHWLFKRMCGFFKSFRIDGLVRLLRCIARRLRPRGLLHQGSSTEFCFLLLAWTFLLSSSGLVEEVIKTDRTRNFLLCSLSPLEFCFLRVWGPPKPVSSPSSLKFRLCPQVLHWNSRSWWQWLQWLISSTVCLSADWFPLCDHQIMFPGQFSLCLSLSPLSQATDNLVWILLRQRVGRTSRAHIIFQAEMGAETLWKGTRLVRNRALTRISIWDRVWFFCDSTSLSITPEVLKFCFKSETEMIFSTKIG